MPENPEQNNPPGDSDRPEWLPENFETPEALAKSYGELQSKLTEQGNELGQLRSLAEHYGELASEVENLRQHAYQQPAPQVDMNAHPFVQAWERAWDEGDSRTALALTAYQVEQGVNNALARYAALGQQQTDEFNPNDKMFALMTENQLAQRYGEEWDTFREEVANYLEQRPYLVPETDDPTEAAAAIADVADMVRAKKMLTDQQQPSGNQQAADPFLQQKLLAQSAEGTAARISAQRDAEKEEWERVKRAAASSYEAGLRSQ